MERTNQEELSRAGLQFADWLTPDHFSQAEEWIAPDCEYSYGDDVLRGAKTILDTFVKNHENAKQKLDRIEYQKGEVEKISERSVSVIVLDRIWVGDQTHDYRDRLIITFGASIGGPESVVRIENRRVEGERDKLLQFFERCGIEWS